uniref:Uncharacterized protein n=1 Tax=Anguilla anguilla TaxID=7936 RepID=A0A0E9XPF9_ANGAN
MAMNVFGPVGWIRFLLGTLCEVLCFHCL